MKAILPYRHTWISQGINGAYSHRGTKAIDFGSLAAFKDYNLYAPFNGTVVWADAISKGGAIAFQSDQPVEWADGTVDYMTVITGHDNSRPVAGKKFTQGELYSHMGTAGGVSKHSHLEVQRGKFKKPTSTIPQQYGNVYKFENTVEPYKALFVTDDTVIRSMAEGSVAEYPWTKEKVMLIKIEKDADYEYKWSVDGNAYYQDYSVTGQGGFSDTALVEDGWELVLKINGSLFYKYNGQYFACGLEKSRGVNNQPADMSAVYDYNACMSIAGYGEDLYFGTQGWIVGNMLERSYCAITGLGLILGGKKRDDLHKGFEEQWNTRSGRTVIGEDEQGNILSYSFAGETGKSGMTCAELQEACLDLNFHNAICLDGGGSVFRWFDGAYDISTSRKVKNALLLYRRKKEQQPEEDWKAKYEAIKTQLESTSQQLTETENNLNTALKSLQMIREIVNEDS